MFLEPNRHVALKLDSGGYVSDFFLMVLWFPINYRHQEWAIHLSVVVLGVSVLMVCLQLWSAVWIA